MPASEVSPSPRNLYLFLLVSLLPAWVLDQNPGSLGIHLPKSPESSTPSKDHGKLTSRQGTLRLSQRKHIAVRQCDNLRVVEVRRGKLWHHQQWQHENAGHDYIVCTKCEKEISHPYAFRSSVSPDDRSFFTWLPGQIPASSPSRCQDESSRSSRLKEVSASVQSLLLVGMSIGSIKVPIPGPYIMLQLPPAPFWAPGFCKSTSFAANRIPGLQAQFGRLWTYLLMFQAFAWIVHASPSLQGLSPILRDIRLHLYAYKVRLLRIRFGYPELDFEILIHLHNILFAKHLHRFISSIYIYI